jgi:hypothetical protein
MADDTITAEEFYESGVDYGDVVEVLDRHIDVHALDSNVYTSSTVRLHCLDSDIVERVESELGDLFGVERVDLTDSIIQLWLDHAARNHGFSCRIVRRTGNDETDDSYDLGYSNATVPTDLMTSESGDATERTPEGPEDETAGTEAPGFAPGDVISDRYVVEERIGSGGLVDVYRARDGDTDRDVALRVPDFESSLPASIIVSYARREAVLLETLEDEGGDPGVVGFVERMGGSEGQSPFVTVCEFVDGPTVADRVRDDGAMHEKPVRRLGKAIAETVGFLHENGVAVRDISPNDIVLRDRERPALVDLNVARSFDFDFTDREPDSTPDISMTNIKGAFVAPEVSDGTATVADIPRSDVYSIGKVLAYAIHGTAPVTSGVDLSKLGIDCTDDFSAVVEKATAEDPADRHESVYDLADALDSEQT